MKRDRALSMCLGVYELCEVYMCEWGWRIRGDFFGHRGDGIAFSFVYDIDLRFTSKIKRIFSIAKLRKNEKDSNYILLHL